MYVKFTGGSTCSTITNMLINSAFKTKSIQRGSTRFRQKSLQTVTFVS